MLLVLNNEGNILLLKGLFYILYILDILTDYGMFLEHVGEYSHGPAPLDLSRDSNLSSISLQDTSILLTLTFPHENSSEISILLGPVHTCKK